MPEIKAAVVGTRFRGPEAIKTLQRMDPESRARLVREPKNRYDANAVQVWFLGSWIGYIPRVANATLARAMDAGAQPIAEVEITPLVRGNRIDREPLLRISWSHPSLAEHRHATATGAER